MAKPADISFPILLVDDEEEILFSSSVIFRSAGFSDIRTEVDSRRVMNIMAEREAALIVLDLYMPFLSGYELLKEINGSYPHIPVIIMTAANEIELAIECMKAGAFDYFVKPVEKSRLLASVNRALELRNLRSEVSSLTRQLLSDNLEHDAAFASIITQSPRMRTIFRYLEVIAGTDQPVLITGETGVGKELVARALHDISGRKGEFIAVNIAGLDDQMFSDTLFGHNKGAFTGADLPREGLLAKAAGGTIFLDEIGDMQISSQVKLLRLLQEKEYYPLGSDTPKKTDARVVVATNRDLHRMIEDNTFRKDLYYRLNAHQVNIPPLRKRREDIPLLLEHFLEDAANTLKKTRPTPPPELGSHLTHYGFPGNVRELRAMVFDAVARHQKGVLSLASFKEVIGQNRKASASDPLDIFHPGSGHEVGPGCMPTLKDAEEALVAHAMKLAGGNQGIAASHLGITRQALNKRLNRKGSD